MAESTTKQNNASCDDLAAAATGGAADFDDVDVKELDRFDYFRFTFSDLHGIARTCMSVPRRHVDLSALRGGFKVGAGFLALNASSTFTIYRDCTDQMIFGNALLKPMKGTLRPLPWATRGKHRVGDFLCETSWMPSFRDGAPQAACPRYVARRQLGRLQELGYRLYAAFEVEFIVLDRSDLKPIFGGPKKIQFLTSQLHAELEEFLYDMEQSMAQGGIDISKLHTEYGPGQLEFVPPPAYGIEAADTAFRIREAVKEICRQRDWQATFMAKVFHDVPGSGLHFNHSLWSTSDPDKNVMYDADSPDNLADVARWWVGGLLKHSASLMALCCPTVNCYRRQGGGLAPDRADWGIDERHVAFRVKNYGKKETYVENRLPSAPANPYLVLAATVAAGIDGINNRLPCPGQRGEAQGDPLARSLPKALDALEADEVMKDALGEEFVRWFVQNKREGEIEKLKDATLDTEREFYIVSI